MSPCRPGLFPHVTYFSRASKDRENSNKGTLLQTSEIDQNTEVYLSAWVRNGGLKLIGFDVAGRQTTDVDLRNHSTLAWNQLEGTYSLSGRGSPPNAFPAKTVKIEVHTVGNLEIATLAAARFQAGNRPAEQR